MCACSVLVFPSVHGGHTVCVCGMMCSQICLGSHHVCSVLAFPYVWWSYHVCGVLAFPLGGGHAVCVYVVLALPSMCVCHTMHVCAVLGFLFVCDGHTMHVVCWHFWVCVMMPL